MGFQTAVVGPFIAQQRILVGELANDARLTNYVCKQNSALGTAASDSRPSEQDRRSRSHIPHDNSLAISPRRQRLLSSGSINLRGYSATAAGEVRRGF